MLKLKDYQLRALSALREYFVECVRINDSNTAFYSTTLKYFGTGIPYRPVADFPELPYICLRVPTGGGKTLIACHSVEATARLLHHTDNPIVLWLVPSNAIREQTAKALKDRAHPYRQALESTIGMTTVYDIEESLYLNKSDIDTGTVIIVSTLQSFRVEDTVGRRVYRDSGSLMDHFSGIDISTFSGLDKNEAGNIIRSLANVLYIRRPIVIVDEAHNARTDLSFDTLKRFNPSCIIEFSATPAREKNPSNILYTVSAAELKAEGMIKLPIRLETRTEWKELLSDAIACRRKLEVIARKEQQQTGEYIRPIMLLQAQPHRQNEETISVETVKETLISDFNIPENQIAIATGDKKEIENIDLSKNDCSINFIITMQALREGWDCPFAYVLCSVAEIRSATYIEQILGRILRLPKANWKNHAELNMAYAFAASPHFHDIANKLTDALIENGFERQEAKDLIVEMPAEQLKLGIDDDKPFLGTILITTPESPDFSGLSDDLKSKIEFFPAEGKIAFRGVMEEKELEDIKGCFKSNEGKETAEIIFKKSNSFPTKDKGTPSERGITFSIPKLSVKQGNFFEEFEETHFLDHPWELSKCDAFLSESEYSEHRPAGQKGEITVTDKGEIQTSFLDNLHEQMSLFGDEYFTLGGLAAWFDKRIPHSDISPQESGIFITSLIQLLIDRRGFSLSQLNYDKYRLKTSIANKMDIHRQAARFSVYQTFLNLNSPTPLVVTPENCFSFDPKNYPYSYPLKSSRYVFKKHYYPEVGNLNDTGEEFECAQFIDQLDEIDFWVRNIEHRSRNSFWLQTKTDKFYPDFVCKLKDGRFLVIEYKGEHLWSGDDAKEKRALGELWAARSNGKCLFIMPKGKDFKAIEFLTKRQ